MFIGGYGACRSPRCDVQFSGLAFSGRPESNRRRPAWEFSAGPSRTLTPSHSSSLSRPPARDASHDFSPLLTRDGQYLGQYGLPEPVSRCPTVAADPERARSAQRPRLGRCPRNFGAPGSRSRPRSPAEPAGARNANHTGSNPRGVAPTVAEAAVPARRRGAGGVGARFGERDGRSSRPHQSLENNSPVPREVQPPSRGRIRAVPEVGGLHHRHHRVARGRRSPGSRDG